jgi:hypothetical protein
MTVVTIAWIVRRLDVRITQTKYTPRGPKMRTTTELLKSYALVGNKLDKSAPDAEAMKFLLRARRAVAAALEARHAEAARRQK